MKRSLALVFAVAASLAVAGGFFACGSSTTTQPDGGNVLAEVGPPAHGDHYQYVVNSLQVPQAREDYSIDLNGDGHADNQLGNIVGALIAQGFMVDQQVNAAVENGSVILLIDVQTTDAAVKDDATVSVVFYVGAPMKGIIPDAGIPDGGHAVGGADFSGNGMFTVDAAVSAGYQFWGKLAGGQFKSNNPVTTKMPANITLKLALVGGTDPVQLVVNGAHVQFQSGADPTSGAPGMVSDANCPMSGFCTSIQGSIKNSDVQNHIIPAVAVLLTKTLQKNPNSAASKMVEQLFDTCGPDPNTNVCCTNPDGTVAKAADMKIDPCEVAANNIIKNVLAPDVQIYDANGKYAPNPANTNRDSLSLGIGFTAVKATFTRP